LFLIDALLNVDFASYFPSRKMEKPDPHKKKLSIIVLHIINSLFRFIIQPQMFTLTNLSSLRKREELGVAGVEDMISIG